MSATRLSYLALVPILVLIYLAPAASADAPVEYMYEGAQAYVEELLEKLDARTTSLKGAVPPLLTGDIAEFYGADHLRRLHSDVLIDLAGHRRKMDALSDDLAADWRAWDRRDLRTKAFYGRISEAVASAAAEMFNARMAIIRYRTDVLEVQWDAGKQQINAADRDADEPAFPTPPPPPRDAGREAIEEWGRRVAAMAEEHRTRRNAPAVARHNEAARQIQTGFDNAAEEIALARRQLCGDLWQWLDRYSRYGREEEATHLSRVIYSYFAHKLDTRPRSLLKSVFDDSVPERSRLDEFLYDEIDVAADLAYHEPWAVGENLLFPTKEPLLQAVAADPVESLRRYDDTVPPISASGTRLEQMIQILSARLVRMYSLEVEQKRHFADLSKDLARLEPLDKLEQLAPEAKPLIDELRDAQRTLAAYATDYERHKSAADAVVTALNQLAEAHRDYQTTLATKAQSVYVDSSTGRRVEKQAAGAHPARKVLDTIKANLDTYRADLASADYPENQKPALRDLVKRLEAKQRTINTAIADAASDARETVQQAYRQLEDCEWRLSLSEPAHRSQAQHTLQRFQQAAADAKAAMAPANDDLPKPELVDRFLTQAEQQVQDAPEGPDFIELSRTFSDVRWKLSGAADLLGPDDDLFKAIHDIPLLSDIEPATFGEAADALEAALQLLATRAGRLRTSIERRIGDILRNDREITQLARNAIKRRADGARLARQVLTELGAESDDAVITQLDKASEMLAEGNDLLGTFDARLGHLQTLTDLAGGDQGAMDLLDNVSGRVQTMSRAVGTVKRGTDWAAQLLKLKKSFDDPDRERPLAFVSETLRTVSGPAEKTGVIGVALVPMLSFYANAADACGTAAIAIQDRIIERNIRTMFDKPEPEYHLYRKSDVRARSSLQNDAAIDRIARMLQVRRLVALVRARSLHQAKDHADRTP